MNAEEEWESVPAQALVVFPPRPGNQSTSCSKDGVWTMVSITSHGSNVGSRSLLGVGPTAVRTMTE